MLNRFAKDTVMRRDNKNKKDEQDEPVEVLLHSLSNGSVVCFSERQKTILSGLVLVCPLFCVKSGVQNRVFVASMRFVQGREEGKQRRMRKKTFKYNNSHRRRSPIDILLWAIFPFLKSDLRAGA